MSIRRALWLPCLLSFVALPSFAQGVHVPFESQNRAASAQCNAGVVYDSGTFSDGYSIGSGSANGATLVQKFDLPAGTVALDQVCTCFARTASGPSSMSFQVVVYDDNGPGGQPGTLLGTVSATANAIPLATSGPAFYSVSLAGSGINLPNTSVYVGARWPGGQIVMCGDRAGSTPVRATYGSSNSGSSWSTTASLYPSATPRVLGIRADPATSTGPSLCVASPTSLCLNGGRFQVSATYQTSDGASGTAQVIKLTDETGYFWFFGASNVEAVLKVLNGCGLNSRYWVFAGGLTDVRTVITVRDTASGVSKVYVNPQGTPFQPIQDTGAFSTCP
jgi:hypothetical protein